MIDVTGLVRTETRLTNWKAFGAASAAAIGLATMAGFADPDYSARQFPIRFALAVLAIGTMYAGYDQLNDLHGSLPVPLRTRLSGRLVSVSLAWGAVLMATGVIASHTMTPVGGVAPQVQVGEFPVGRTMLEGATLAAMGLLLAAVASRVRGEKLVMPASAILGVLALIGFALPAEISPWQLPGQPGWITAGRTAIAVVVVCLAGTTALSWDARMMRRPWRARR